ncbi:Uncharacterised protein g3322 [Pycnogonum litorale]
MSSVTISVVIVALLLITASSLPSRCKYQPDTGDCRASFTRYYYNLRLRDCKKFVFGGCDGNANKFDTLSECRRICR